MLTQRLRAYEVFQDSLFRFVAFDRGIPTSSPDSHPTADASLIIWATALRLAIGNQGALISHFWMLGDPAPPLRERWYGLLGFVKPSYPRLPITEDNLAHELELRRREILPSHQARALLASGYPESYLYIVQTFVGPTPSPPLLDTELRIDRLCQKGLVVVTLFPEEDEWCSSRAARNAHLVFGHSHVSQQIDAILEAIPKSLSSASTTTRRRPREPFCEDPNELGW